MTEATISKIEQDDRLTDGGRVENHVRARFKVGDMGPFQVSVPKDDNWEIALRAAIDREVQRVKALLA